jgi:hypothetical protein
MRIAFLIRVLVMLTMCCDPKDRATFQSQCAAHSQKVLHPLRSLITSMGKKPMVSDTYAKTSGDPPQNHRKKECLPTEEEQRGQCADVERNHDEGGDPNDRLRKCSVMREELSHSHIVPPFDLMGTCAWGRQPGGNTCATVFGI